MPFICQVYIDGHLCGTISYSSSKTSYEIECGRSGKTVKITQDSYRYPLTLCEVEVFGTSAPAAIGAYKEITFSSVTQSSTLWEGDASRAIDGDINGRWDKK